MTRSDSGAVWLKAVLVQLAIVAGVVVFYKAYLPRMDRARSAAAAQAREQKIEAFFKSTVAEDPDREVAATGVEGESLSHPQKLKRTPSLEEVQQALGAPGSEFSDYRQGQHLVWTGSSHSLEAIFDQGTLEILRLENLRRGHGVIVYAQSAYWASF